LSVLLVRVGFSHDHRNSVLVSFAGIDLSLYLARSFPSLRVWTLGFSFIGKVLTGPIDSSLLSFLSRDASNPTVVSAYAAMVSESASPFWRFFWPELFFFIGLLGPFHKTTRDLTLNQTIPLFVVFP